MSEYRIEPGIKNDLDSKFQSANDDMEAVRRDQGNCARGRLVMKCPKQNKVKSITKTFVGIGCLNYPDYAYRGKTGEQQYPAEYSGLVR